MGDKFGLATTIDKIISQAHQRSLQISLLGDQQSYAIRKKIVALGRQKVDEEFNAKKKKQLALRRISRSESINNNRMRKIRKKYDLCEKIFEKVELQLQQLSTREQHQNTYKIFLIETITDGLVRLFQEKVDIRCLQHDVPIIKEIIPLCVKSYQQYMENQIGFKYSIDLSIASNMTLEKRELINYKPLEKTEEDKKTIGGVILADQTGNITFKATFDSRLNILKEICLPDIRSELWGDKNIVKL